jgi:serine protein kinase
VPYLLDYRVERKVYQEQVGDVLRGIHIAPHVPRILALWGVMTRLRPPNAGDYSAEAAAGAVAADAARQGGPVRVRPRAARG